MRENLLDIIIIGKNEGKVLEQTFLSVKRACEVFKNEFGRESNIIYIDSNSTDNSIEIAKRNSVNYKILTGYTNPAIGRIEGVNLTGAEYIFFLDGDTEVEEEWLCDGVKFLDKNDNVAGVGGRLVFNIYNSENELIWRNTNYRNNTKDIEDIYDGVGGTFIYRRSVYEMSGGFSSNYRNTEEFDLMLRIIALGYSVKRINKPMAIHNDYKTSEANFINRYLFTKDTFIPGRVFINAPKSKKTCKILFYKYWLHLLQLPTLIILLFLLINKEWIPIGISLSLLTLCHFFYKKMNLKRTLISIISMSFYSLGFYIGLLKK